MSTRSQRQRRRFSKSIQRSSVHRIDKGDVSITELCRELEVSRNAVYKWMAKYSVIYRKQNRFIVEDKSQHSRVKSLEKEVKELQAALGRKQMELEYLSKLIELTEKESGIEILKKDESKPWNGSNKTEQNIRGQ